MAFLRWLTLLWIGLAVPAGAQPVTPEDFLERAREHFERRRFLNTLDSLRVVLEMTARDNARDNATKREAEILAAMALSALGRREEAANMYERAVFHGYQEKTAYAYLGQFYESRAQWQKSAEYYARYFDSDKGDAVTAIRYAVVLGRMGKRADARQVLAAIEASAAAKKEKCESFETRKKWREALTCYSDYRRSAPDRESAYLALYRTSRALRDRAAAQRHALELYFLFGDQPRYIWPLIETRISERRFYDARLLLEEVILLRGEDSDAEKLLANLKNEASRATDRPWHASVAEMKLLDEVSAASGKHTQ